MPTFADVMSARLRRDPGQPLVTFYDDVTGERVELSVTTYANWVAKASSLLVDELDLGRGDTIRIDLPPHWLGTVFLGAAWTAGLVVTDADDPDAVVCGPDPLGDWAPRAAELVVLACSLLPLGVRFAEPVPAGVHDVGVEIWSQPDAFIPWDPPGEGDPAIGWENAGGFDPFEARELAPQDEPGPGPASHLNHRLMIETAAAGNLVSDGDRLLSTANPASPPGVAAFLEPVVSHGSLVLVARAGQERLDAIYAAERATARFPA